MPASVEKIRRSTEIVGARHAENGLTEDHEAFANAVAAENVNQACSEIHHQSESLRSLHSQALVAIVGAIFDVTTGRIAFMDDARAAEEQFTLD